MDPAEINRENIVAVRADGRHAPRQFAHKLPSRASNAAPWQRAVGAVIGIPSSVGEPNLPGTLGEIPAECFVVADEGPRRHVDDANAGSRIGEWRMIDAIDLERQHVSQVATPWAHIMKAEEVVAPLGRLTGRSGDGTRDTLMSPDAAGGRMPNLSHDASIRNRMHPDAVPLMAVTNRSTTRRYDCLPDWACSRDPRYGGDLHGRGVGRLESNVLGLPPPSFVDEQHGHDLRSSDHAMPCW
jgi:hypothetical protein